jgi:hypothetical protein
LAFQRAASLAPDETVSGRRGGVKTHGADQPLEALPLLNVARAAMSNRTHSERGGLHSVALRREADRCVETEGPRGLSLFVPCLSATLQLLLGRLACGCRVTRGSSAFRISNAEGTWSTMPKARHWANPKLLDNELAAGTLETTTMPRRLNTYQVLCMNTQEVGSAKRRAPRQGQPQIFGNWPISRCVDSGFGLSKTANED